MQEHLENIPIRAALVTSGLPPECAQQGTCPHTDTFIFYDGESGSVGLMIGMDGFFFIYSFIAAGAA